MATDNPIPVPEVDITSLALFVAKVIRDDLEGFHIKYNLQDAMRELNPTIRNAVYSACYVFLIQDHSAAARKCVKDTLRAVPPYWEAPQLTENVRRFLDGSYLQQNF